MKTIISYFSAIIARAVIKKYQPRIVAITGSYGKTSTRELLYTVISGFTTTTRSYGSYNNELGVPLTILQEKTAGKSIIGWLKIFYRGCMLLIKRIDYPETLIVEMGADKPGDIQYLTTIAPPNTAVLTAISNAHREYYSSLKAIASEKRSLLRALPANGFAILNADDELVSGSRVPQGVTKLTYGVINQATVQAEDCKLYFNMSNGEVTGGVRFKIKYHGSTIPVHLPNVMGLPIVYSALASFAVAIAHGYKPLDIAARFADYKPVSGRLRLLPGIKNTAIIDDSYNSSPDAVRAALQVLSDDVFNGHRRWAVLGDMRELGVVSEESHKQLGSLVAELGIDRLVTVGKRAVVIADYAMKGGLLPEQIQSFADPVSAGKYVQENIIEGDVLLIKGSEGKGQDMIRLEKVVKEIMREPQLAEYLLVRQSKEWN